MNGKDLQALSARIDVLSIAVQELGRAMSPAVHKDVAMAIRQRVEALARKRDTPDLDEDSLISELAPLLGALS